MVLLVVIIGVGEKARPCALKHVATGLKNNHQPLYTIDNP